MYLKSAADLYQDNFREFQETIFSNLPGIKKITQQLAIAVTIGFLFNWLQIPVGWLLGPMAVGIGYAITGGNKKPLPATFGIVGQAIIALTTATGFSVDTLAIAKMYAIPLLLYILITGGMSLFNGYLLWRFSPLDMATSIIGCIPGAAPSLVAMSEEMGADAIATAILQYIRVLLVALIVPAVASLFFAPDSPQIPLAIISTQSNSSINMGWELLILTGCGFLGNWGGKKLKVPLSIFLGPFIVGLIAVWLLPFSLQVPPFVFAVGLIFVGLSIGVKFDLKTVYKLRQAVLIEIVLVILLILICLGVGYEFHLMTRVDSLTGVLGASPGAISAIMASTIQLGGDSGWVLTMQMTRMLIILLITPWVASFFKKSNS
ncbi:MAG TPA: hypothetical protein DEG17_15535 [Cyanobacteria bacterium UBA11149]|nr:hypothetical protein [Cyanobacteria bacterium UBA11367]HBE60021.1 hypothetical protein [Cyanobacteria bacterium UBA11366]HBK63410.1 hypothetical protein [Cyanobacteria bacterium UBA11166]HBR74609.1 hypothetical protein [Cyanobacteria bacterium UBA11159]HBS72091.1 hypothetical protein [Cyanobacteria bacterium UBA11153]HBW90244.1 hypothetical protein [Cyanobacteria bacterium UBA11149]HCA96149.1 hypothetical protein [Cyanobacteria bacterium UBA9226]